MLASSAWVMAFIESRSPPGVSSLDYEQRRAVVLCRVYRAVEEALAGGVHVARKGDDIDLRALRVCRVRCARNKRRAKDKRER